MTRRPPVATRTDTLLPYTTLVRSIATPASRRLSIRFHTAARVSPFSRASASPETGPAIRRCSRARSALIGAATSRHRRRSSSSTDGGREGMLEVRCRASGDYPRPRRSEEHTSELQSLMRNSYAVFCLKQKTNIPKNITQYQDGSITIWRTNDDYHLGI